MEVIKVEGAVDMWALGIIAFELLTQRRVFLPFEMDTDQIVGQLLGHEQLPWEGPDKDNLLPKLRVLKRTVLACLARDPAQRPTAQALLGKWNNLFESTTGTTRDDFAVQADGA
jgi:serine/threonine protein kinase